jgi:hypothetical protein
MIALLASVFRKKPAQPIHKASLRPAASSVDHKAKVIERMIAAKGL